MKRFLSIILVVLVAAAIAGCGKKQEVEDMQPITMDSLSTMTAVSQVSPDLKAQETKAISPVTPAVTRELGVLPPPGPYKPTAQEIQSALQHAGYYAGAIDGKIGPKSKKAIEEFQAANGLKVDGKVGPKTWEVLSRHLNVPAEMSKR
ncbi:MAG: peptidoglycan-binding domain-containing protein [Candidatus Omnitrophota bacterium]|jgi:peptidoglycan hydrolase-like protein with peptidoglycan-binding domain